MTHFLPPLLKYRQQKLTGDQKLDSKVKQQRLESSHYKHAQRTEGSYAYRSKGRCNDNDPSNRELSIKRQIRTTMQAHGNSGTRNYSSYNEDFTRVAQQ